MGSIIHAQNGEVVIAAGANLGAGVLILGQCQIGENSCIGSLTTVLNSAIARGQVVPPGSLIDGISDSISRRETDPHATAAASTEVSLPNETVVSTSTTQVVAEVVTEVKSSEVKPGEPPSKSAATTHAQEQLNRLMGKLFPHRQSLDIPPDLSSP
jgi:carbon dioxide concentrating mechanism protein CcmN